MSLKNQSEVRNGKVPLPGGVLKVGNKVGDKLLNRIRNRFSKLGDLNSENKGLFKIPIFDGAFTSHQQQVIYKIINFLSIFFLQARHDDVII